MCQPINNHQATRCQTLSKTKTYRQPKRHCTTSACNTCTNKQRHRGTENETLAQLHSRLHTVTCQAGGPSPSFGKADGSDTKTQRHNSVILFAYPNSNQAVLPAKVVSPAGCCGLSWLDRGKFRPRPHREKTQWTSHTSHRGVGSHFRGLLPRLGSLVSSEFAVTLS